MISAEEVRDRLRRHTPEQWPVLLENAEFYLEEYGFKSLTEFVTAPVNNGGLQIPLSKAKELLYFNPGYKHKAEKLCKKMGIAELAKSVDSANPNGVKSSYTKSENSIATGKQKTDTERRIAKLKRDHPEIAGRLEAGEFATVAEAERAAGVKPPKRNLKRIHIDLNNPVESALAALQEVLSASEIKDLEKLLRETKWK